MSFVVRQTNESLSWAPSDGSVDLVLLKSLFTGVLVDGNRCSPYEFLLEKLFLKRTSPCAVRLRDLLTLTPDSTHHVIIMGVFVQENTKISKHGLDLCVRVFGKQNLMHRYIMSESRGDYRQPTSLIRHVI